MAAKKREKRLHNLLKHFYGIKELDEYREKELNRINSYTLIILWWFMLMANVVFLFIITKNPEIAAWTMLAVNLIIYGFAIPLATLIPSYRLKLTDTEVRGTELKPIQRKVTLGAIISGLIWGIMMHIFMALLNWWQGGNLAGSLLNLKMIIIWSIGGFLFGFVMWLIARSKLKKAKED